MSCTTREEKSRASSSSSRTMLGPFCLQLLLLLWCCWCCCMVAVGNALQVNECKLDYMRLPLRVQPNHYKLQIRTHPEADTFTGRVEISVRHDQNPNDVLCMKGRGRGSKRDYKTEFGNDWPLAIACDRSRIILNAHETLEILEADYRQEDANGLAIPVASVCKSSVHDLLVVELSREPELGSSGWLRMRYRGEMRTDFTGLFRADSRDARTNETKHFAVTQFESASARRAFPCFDEPAFKATYELTLEHPSHLLALANTQAVASERVVFPVGSEFEELQEDEEEEEEYTRTRFAVTPRMSSYLLAFAVGEFDRIETSVLGGRMTLGWYTAPGRAQDAQSSMKIAADSYLALEEFFNVSQPLSKIDFLSCKEFPGAMENWGLITVEEVSALRSSDKHAANDVEATNLHYSYVTVAHELAHQWFGNLVTMRWWDDLWLNEGFAEWLSNYLVNQLYPELGGEYVYVLRARRSAFAKDAKRDETHPIKNSRLQTVEEIEESFDEITYEKAEAVLNMLADHLGHEQFKSGLRAYIRANQYDNTDDSDLWRALSGATSPSAGLDVKHMMHTWIQQAGFPLIQVKLKSSGRPGGKNRILQVSQSRFGPASVASLLKRHLEPKWVVPITMWVSDGGERVERIKFVMSNSRDEIQLPAWFDPTTTNSHWLKLNANFAGFYRVAYRSPELMQGLRGAIESKQMEPLDRLQVLEEQLGLLKAGLVREQEFLKVLAWYRHEEHDAVVDLIVKSLAWLDLDMVRHEQEGGHLYRILIEYYERNGRFAPEPNGPSLIKSLARADTMERLVAANYGPIIAEAIRVFEDTQGRVPEFARSPIFAAVAKRGSDAQFEQVMRAVESLDSDRVKAQAIEGLKGAIEQHRYRRLVLKQRFKSEAGKRRR